MTRESGNAFFITLVSVILLGALTFVLSRQTGGTSAGSDTLSPERISIYADKLIGDSADMANVIQQMSEMGMASFDPTLPSSPYFSNPPLMNKVYHPAGGGMNVPSAPPAEMMQTGYNVAQAGWFLATGESVGWSQSGAQDVVYAFFYPNDAVCMAINDKLIGNTTIPVTSQDIDDFHSNLSWGTNSGDSTFDRPGACLDCVGVPSLCIKDGSGNNMFYSIVLSR